MGAKLKAVKGELILLCLTAVFLCGLAGLSCRDRQAAQIVITEHPLPPETVELVMVDLNTAAAEELTSLPGIGQALAEQIVAYRAANGPFTAVEQLTEVSGIGEKKLEELRDYVTVSGPTDEAAGEGNADMSTDEGAAS